MYDDDDDKVLYATRPTTTT